MIGAQSIGCAPFFCPEIRFVCYRSGMSYNSSKERMARCFSDVMKHCINPAQAQSPLVIKAELMLHDYFVSRRACRSDVREREKVRQDEIVWNRNLYYKK